MNMLTTINEQTPFFLWFLHSVPQTADLMFSVCNAQWMNECTKWMNRP